MSHAPVVNRKLLHFLIVWDRDEQRLLTVRRFDDVEEAEAEYARLEGEHGKKLQREIVLISADSLSTVKKTHSRYFEAEEGAPF